MEAGDGETALSVCVEETDPGCMEETAPGCAETVLDCGLTKPGCVEETDPDTEVAELRLRAETLKQELEECKAELNKLQKQLTNSKRLQKNTESYNEDLRRQVEELSAELHQRKKKDKDRTDAETQTEEYVWTDTDYYNYYYGGYYQDSAAAGDAQESLVPPGVEEGVADATEVTDVTEATEEMAEEAGTNQTQAEPAALTAAAAETAEVYLPEDMSVVPPETSNAEEGDGSIADMLRATAEQAMTQTGFVFDETTGMYYDHSTGFYYDSVSQLYYDNNTGIYYYYDAESGKYQFHSRIEVAAAQTEPAPEKNYSEWKSWKLKKLMSELKKTPQQDSKEFTNKNAKAEEEIKRDEKATTKKSQESRKPRPRSRSRSRSHSRSRSPSRRRRDSPKRREDKRRRHRNGSPYEDRDRGRDRSRSRERSRSRRKKRKSERHRRRKRSVTRSNGSEVNSEPEEGELTESERESTPSSRGSGRSEREERGDKERGDKERGSKERGSKERGSKERGSKERGSKERGEEESQEELETQNQEVCSMWPPCVRVTVVRSPVLQVGTLFIITADSTATIGREKDMNHAIRIAEMGVSKFHAEVYFDQEQQCYMLVDQGSQNGTVINGNRILQPKMKSEPQSLMHGDEVKMGDTVLSFHIHPGTDTCDGCEPGQIMAHLSKYKREETGAAPSKEDKEALRVKELKNMKAKYGLKSNEESKALRNSRYKDRAQSRRQTVGSEGVFQRDDAPASVHQEISEGNKGRKMLEKMGWKKGEGLGKEGTGIKDPIELRIRKSQSGLGSAAAVSVDDPSLTKTKSQMNWEKARERFAESCQPKTLPPAGGERDPTAWVRGEGTEEAPDAQE